MKKHRETALAVLQQEILTVLRKKKDKAEKLEAEHKKESEFSSDMAKMETDRILLQIEDDKFKNISELTSFMNNLIAEHRLKDIPLLCQAFNEKNSLFKKINTKGLDEMIQQQMIQLEADLISKLNNTLEVRIAEWNNLCGQVVCQLNNSPEICEGISHINWTPVTLIPPTTLSSLLTFASDTVDALKKDPQKTIAAALGTAVSVVVLRPITLPIIALFDVLFVAYQKHELSKKQMCERIAEIWDDCAQKINGKVLEIMKNEYQSIEQYYKNFCQSRLEKADALQAKVETLEKTVQAIARCEAIVI